MNRNFFKDIIKNYKIFIILELLIVFSTILFTEITNSYFLSKRSSLEDSQVFTAVPIDLEKNFQKIIYEELDSLFSRGGMTYFSSEKLNQKYDENITVVTFNSSNKPKNRYFWIVSNSFLNKHGLRNVKVLKSKDILNKPEIENKLDDGNSTIIEPLEYKYNKISNYKLSGIELISLIENTKFNEDAINLSLDKEFKNIFDNTYIKCIEKKSANEEELTFIKRYMMPLLIMLLSSNCFVFIILNNSLLDYYTYTKYDYLNISYDNLFKKNSSFISSLFILSIAVVFYFNKFRINFAMFLILFFNIVIFLIFECISYKSIKNRYNVIK